MAIVTASDIQARLSAKAYLKLFNRDGTGIDETFVATCLEEAESELVMRTRAAFPQGLEPDGALVDPRIKGAGVALAIYAAVRYGALASGSEESPYRRAYLDALAFVDALCKDNGVRAETAAGGERPRPRAASTGTADADGAATNVYARAADRDDWSAY